MDNDGRASLAVVIPTLGRPSLRAALEALAAQEDAEAFGVVVVHGPEIGEEQVRALVPAALPSRLAIIEVSERSVGARRNAGAAAAPGAWLAFTDDDCRVPPRWVTSLARYRRSHPDVDIAGGAVVEPVRRSPIYSYMRRINYMAGPDTMKVRPDGIPSLGAANLLVRREAFERLGGFDPELASTEDYELLVRARRHGLTLGTYLDDPPVEHRHVTTLRGFVRRYRGYGRGVAQTVLRHGLDAAGHRLEPEALGPLQRLHSVLRFAGEDLRRHPPQPGTRLWARCGAHGVLAVLRAFAFHRGAWELMAEADGGL